MPPGQFSKLRSKQALTRAEIIFSLVCLALLIGFLFPAYQSARSCPRTSHETTVVKAICNALKAYREDYSRFPRVAPPHLGKDEFIFVGDSQSGATVSNAGLFDVLRAIDRGVNAKHALNKRQQKYFEDKKASDRERPREGFADGGEFPNAMQGQLLDSWGSQYCVVMAAGGSEELDLRSIYTDAPNPIRFPVIAFSLGKDRQLGISGDRKLHLNEDNNSKGDVHLLH